jgi:hypothetical protein
LISVSPEINELAIGAHRAFVCADRKESKKMKKLVSRVLIAGVALSGLVAAEAQTKIVTANVPFSFYMRSAAMPGGAYQVDALAPGRVIALRTRGSAEATTVYQITGKADEAPRLVFHRYGDTYFLSEIWSGNGNIGFQLARSRQEKELASNGTAPVVAVVRLAVH